MDKQAYLNESEAISRDIVKLAISLPDSQIGTRAKKELIDSSTQISALLQIAFIEDSGKETIDKLNFVLEKSGLAKFWLKFVSEEGITQAIKVNNLLDRLANHISDIILLRNSEQSLAVAKTTYAGEWFLDD